MRILLILYLINQLIVIILSVLLKRKTITNLTVWLMFRSPRSRQLITAKRNSLRVAVPYT